MSKETRKWLNRNVLVGFEAKHGKAWHYNAAAQGDEPNHYPGPIPPEDVVRRLFHWKALEQPLVVDTGVKGPQEVPEFKAIYHSKTGHIFQLARKSYVIHQYEDWLLDRVAVLLEAPDLRICSAGLLKGGARAWVTVETPDTLTSASGIKLRPQLLATSSHDSSLATMFKMIQTIVVCDNTLAMALGERGPVVYARHTSRDVFEILTARQALDLVVESGQTALNFLDRLADIPVSDEQWARIVDAITPIPEDSLPRVRARLENTRHSYEVLYRSDSRCAPWMGTAFGVFQVFNTHRLHLSGTDDNRLERNMAGIMTNGGSRRDAATLQVIDRICGPDLFINN